MKNLKWWFRIVGGFNLLLGLANLAMIAFSSSTFADTLPYKAQHDVTAAFTDAWLTFVLDLVVVGAFLLWASRNPAGNITLAWLAMSLEALHGVVADAIWIGRGYDAASYLAFIGVHVAIVAWGVIAVRSARGASVGAEVTVAAA